MNRKRRREARPRTLRRQRDVLCDVMLSAGQCETWLTLVELARMTHYGEASISAQLRHLRKPQHGSFVLQKRRREMAEVVCSVEHGPVWEYRLSRAARAIGTAAVGGQTRGGALGAATSCRAESAWCRKQREFVAEDSGRWVYGFAVGRGSDERAAGIGV